MDGLTYLSEVPAIVINSDPMRLATFMQNNLGVFSHIQRLEATVPVPSEAGALKWRLNTVTALEKMLELGWIPKTKFVATGAAKPAAVSRRADLQRLYAATAGCYHSHLRALSLGIGLGWKRFMIMEDDAAPRLDLLSKIEAPPERDLAVWAGAYPMGAWRTDHKNYSEGRAPRWKLIGNPYRKYKTTAYEVTIRGAERLLDVMHNWPIQADIAWWPYMKFYGGVRLDPMGFGETGTTTRSSSSFARDHMGK